MWSAQAEVGADPFALPAFIISLVGLVGALLAVGWQVAVFKMSASNVKVEIEAGALDQQGGFLSERIPLDRRGRRQLEEGGFFLTTVRIAVISTGRMPAHVHKCRLRFSREDGLEIAQNYDIPETSGPALPHRIEHHDRTTWVVNADPVFRVTSAIFGGPRNDIVVYAEVALGSGNIVRSKEQLPLLILARP